MAYKEQSNLHKASRKCVKLNFAKRLSEAWFGGSDYYRLIYTFYILGGIWVLRRKYIENNPYLFFFHYVLQVVASLACVASFISFVYDAYLIREDIEKLSYNLGVTLFFTTSLFRFLLLTIKKDEFEDLLLTVDGNLHLEDVGKSDRDLGFLKAGERQLKRISIIFYSMLVFGVVTKLSAHILTEHSLPIPFPYVDYMESPLYEIVFVLEAVGFTHFLAVIIAQQMTIDGVFVRVLSHYSILSRNVMETEKVFVTKDLDKAGCGVLMGGNRSYKKLREYDGKLRQEMVFAMLKKNIIHHQEILKIIKRMQKALRELFFIQIFGGGLLIIDLILHLTLRKHSLLLTISQSTYSFAALLDITFVCYYGSEIEKHSHEAARSLYAIDWLEMDLKNRYTLKFFQQALFKQPVIKAGNVFSINLNMYLKFLNSLYSYMAFMQNSVRSKV